MYLCFTILQNCTLFQFNKLQVYKIYNVYKVYKFTCLQNFQSNATYNFNITYNYNVTKFTTLQRKIYLRGMSTVSMYQIICHGI